ncbi:MAG: DUF3857 domain-containing protein [Planctomycetes bacterium]|nr:DUF3857 domain-containing protein [Planctomycetota bacterium]
MRIRRVTYGLLCAPLLLCAALAVADDDVKARIAAAGDADKYNSDVVVVFDHTDVTVRPNGLGVATNHKVVKVLREGGIRSQAVQTFPFDPHTNRLELKAIRVYRAADEVEEVAEAAKRQQPQPVWGMYWGAQQFVITIPRLEIGDAVETITELTGFNVAYLADDGFDDRNALGVPLQPPVPGHWHDEVHFWSGSPVIEKRYTVRMPKDKPLQYEVYNGEVAVTVIMDGDHMVYCFEKRDIAPFKGEPSMESMPNVAPKLLLATLPTWNDKARWLHGVSEPSLAADDEIRAKVAEIIKDCQTDEEKYTALNHWVAENIRYSGTSRGMCEGYTIHPSTETFRDRCGVCKDKAGMLVTMLRVAGFDSFTVMTMARQRVDRIPADQFNHCVTCIRWPDGSLKLLDPTWMPKSRDNWSTLEPLQHVVYGLPEGKELSTSPYFPPEECQASWRAETRIDENNRLTGALEFEAVGTPEGRMRRTLSGLRPEERREFFDETFQRLAPNARATNVQCTDPVDFSGPLAVKCDFEAEHYVLGQNQKRFLALPMLQTVFGDRTLYDLFGNNSAKERKYGLRLLATRLGRFEETVRLPAGWKVTDKPEAVSIDGPAAALHFELETTPGQIHYTCELVVKEWTIAPEHYANFKEVVEKFEELSGRVITCELEG